MAIVVQKYGGSSVANTERIRVVADRIAATCAEGKQVCVVVSAMGSTTDELLARARELTESPSRRELDMLLTCGERASMALLSMAVAERGYEAISFTGSQCGIMTNDRHSGARIVEVRPIRVQDELDRGKVVIVAGFQGVSYKREITTLGRGGSDTTAVALAAALGADYCELCSDVDGVYSADPRIVDAAELRDAISHDVMLELAASGARVLHADAVEFARQSGIALYARATSKVGGGTRIDHPATRQQTAVAVSSQRELVRIVARGDDAADEIVRVATEGAVQVLNLGCGLSGATLWLALSDVPDWPALRLHFEQFAKVEDGFGAVSLVGDLLGRDPQAIAEFRGAAAEASVALAELAATPLRITGYCAEADVERLTAAVHRQFCEAPEVPEVPQA